MYWVGEFARYYIIRHRCGTREEEETEEEAVYILRHINRRTIQSLPTLLNSDRAGLPECMSVAGAGYYVIKVAAELCNVLTSRTYIVRRTMYDVHCTTYIVRTVCYVV